MAAIPKEKPSRIDQARAEFARYKADVKARGKPFYPYAMFHDTVMSLVVVCTIIGLAVIWKWSAWGPDHDPTHQGLLGPEVDPPADPGTTSFVPRPDWYFYFLFYLLRIFKWPESVFLGTVGVPTIALILLIGLPFLDRRLVRRPSARPVAMVGRRAHDRLDGGADVEGRDGQGGARLRGHAELPNWKADEHLPPAAFPGAKLFASAGCTACHTYVGAGGSQLGAPDLTAIGTRNLGIHFQINHLKCPSCVNPGSPMPQFASLGDDRLNQLAIFLEASKGTH